MTENRIKNVHFIGIGGVGMSGIARVAKEQGMEVSGSDLRESRYTQQLREAGVRIYIGQKASNLEIILRILKPRQHASKPRASSRQNLPSA